MVLVGKVTFVGDDDILYDDADAFLDCIREELPYRDTTGFRYEVLTDDPAIRKAADDILPSGEIHFTVPHNSWHDGKTGLYRRRRAVSYEMGQRTDAGAHPRRGQLYRFTARAQHDEAV